MMATFMQTLEILIENGTIGVSEDTTLPNHKSFMTFPFVSGLDGDIAELELSTRADNGMMRNKLFKISDLIKFLSEGKSLNDLSGLGTNSIKEIHTHLLEWQWEQLDYEARCTYIGYLICCNTDKTFKSYDKKLCTNLYK